MTLENNINNIKEELFEKYKKSIIVKNNFVEIENININILDNLVFFKNKIRNNKILTHTIENFKDFLYYLNENNELIFEENKDINKNINISNNLFNIEIFKNKIIFDNKNDVDIDKNIDELINVLNLIKKKIRGLKWLIIMIMSIYMKNIKI